MRMQNSQVEHVEVACLRHNRTYMAILTKPFAEGSLLTMPPWPEKVDRRDSEMIRSGIMRASFCEIILQQGGQQYPGGSGSQQSISMRAEERKERENGEALVRKRRGPGQGASSRARTHQHAARKHVHSCVQQGSSVSGMAPQIRAYSRTTHRHENHSHRSSTGLGLYTRIE